MLLALVGLSAPALDLVSSFYPRRPRSQHDISHHCAAKITAVLPLPSITFEVFAINSSSEFPSSDLRPVMAAPPDLNAILAALGKQASKVFLRAHTNNSNSCRTRPLYHSVSDTATAPAATPAPASRHACRLSRRNAYRDAASDSWLQLPPTHNLR